MALLYAFAYVLCIYTKYQELRQSRSSREGTMVLLLSRTFFTCRGSSSNPVSAEVHYLLLFRVNKQKLLCGIERAELKASL